MSESLHTRSMRWSKWYSQIGTISNLEGEVRWYRETLGQTLLNYLGSDQVNHLNVEASSFSWSFKKVACPLYQFLPYFCWLLSGFLCLRFVSPRIRVRSVQFSPGRGERERWHQWVEIRRERKLGRIKFLPSLHCFLFWIIKRNVFTATQTWNAWWSGTESHVRSCSAQ